RPAPTKAQAPSVQAKAASPVAPKSSLSAPSTPLPTKDSAWTLVEAKPRRKRPTSGHSSDPEASRVALGFKPKKTQRSQPPPGEASRHPKAVPKGANPKSKVRKPSALVNGDV